MSSINHDKTFEGNFPVGEVNGFQTNKDITTGGTSNFDASGSTGTFKFPTGASSGETLNVVDVTTATQTLTQAQSGSIVLLDRAAGTTVTLPAPVKGLNYRFVVAVSVSSPNTAKIITDSTTATQMQGYLGVPVSAGTQKIFFADGSTSVSINLNGVTTGGLIGGEILLACTGSSVWQVSGNVEGSGTVATPFATS